jgi:hypothetical protein
MRVTWERCKSVVSGIRVDETERALIRSWAEGKHQDSWLRWRNRTRAWRDYIMRRYTVSSRAAAALKVRISGPRQTAHATSQRRC